MQQITVIIGSALEGLFWEGIERLLAGTSDIDVIRSGSEAELQAALRQHRAHVLLLEISDTEGQTAYQHYFDLRPGLAIIGLDPAGAETVVRLRDLGRDLLVRLIRTVSAEATRSQAGSVRRLRLLGAEDVTRLASPQVVPVSASDAPYADSFEHLADVRRWIDCVLRECLVEEDDRDSDVSTPGWAMGVDRAWSLLGENGADATLDELRDQRAQLETRMAARIAASRRAGTLPRLVVMADAFGLDDMAQRAITVALAAEIDGRYTRVFGYLNDDLTRRRPTPSLLARILFPDDPAAWRVRRLLSVPGPIADYRLVILDPGELATLPPPDVGLVPAPDLVAALIADDDHEPNYAPHLAVLNPIAEAGTVADDAATQALRDGLGRLDRCAGISPLLQLAGDEACVRWFERVARRTGHTLVRFDLSAVDELSTAVISQQAIAAARVAVLHDAILLVTGFVHLASDAERERVAACIVASAQPLVRALACHGGPPSAGMHGRDGTAVWLIDHARLGLATRSAMWRERAQDFGLAFSEADACAVARTIGFDESEVDAVLRLCGGAAEAADGNLPLATVQAAARVISRTKVPPMARRLETIFSWDDIVLPEALRIQLGEIPAHIRHADDVFDDWGYRARLPYGRGVSALFSGPSGTGKTMTAQIIARELAVELFQVDLANTVSKYIGETEKNLDRIFKAAESASAVLLFDEADALFGKRTEIRDAHDRYANVEVAYLLQRMEAHSGLVILTTNFRQNLDKAFMRRLRFVIEFPAPDAIHREAIWRRVFPDDAPLAEDVSFGFLARRLELTGGHIQQIAIRAAFAAVGEDAPIGMRHIVHATREELRKLGMLNSEQTLAQLVA